MIKSDLAIQIISEIDYRTLLSSTSRYILSSASRHVNFDHVETVLNFRFTYVNLPVNIEQYRCFSQFSPNYTFAMKKYRPEPCSLKILELLKNSTESFEYQTVLLCHVNVRANTLNAFKRDCKDES